MNEIEQKALALAIEVREDDKMRLCPDPTLLFGNWEALCRAIEQHEAFRQEVSGVMTYIKALYPTLPRNFNRFIIPAPKPDPLVEAMHDCGVDRFESWADQLRAALEARGLEIREKNDDRRRNRQL
jgi:hypothetical protein